MKTHISLFTQDKNSRDDNNITVILIHSQDILYIPLENDNVLNWCIA